MDLLAEFCRGNRYALARALTLVEAGGPEGMRFLREMPQRSGRALVVGLTGAPGSGKSCLMASLVKVIRREGLTVGVLAIDPTSPKTGGAVLGDRLRLSGVWRDEGIFVRSMASRGALGGLAVAALDAVRVMEAFGKDVILVETVGVGQAEVEVAYLADAVALVMAPGSGDVVQTLKAGVLEMADVLVVNKADLPGAQDLLRLLYGMLEEMPGMEQKPPLLATRALTGEGVDELWQACKALCPPDEETRLARRKLAFKRQLIQLALQRLEVELQNCGLAEELASLVLRQQLSREEAVGALLKNFTGGKGRSHA